MHEVQAIRKDKLIASLDVVVGKDKEPLGVAAVRQTRVVEPRADDGEFGDLLPSTCVKTVEEERFLQSLVAHRVKRADGEECHLRMPRQAMEGVHDVGFDNVSVPLFDDEEGRLFKNKLGLLDGPGGEGAPVFARRWLQLEGRTGGEREAPVGW